MEKENEVLFNVMYDSIDLFLELKKEVVYLENIRKILIK